MKWKRRPPGKENVGFTIFPPAAFTRRSAASMSTAKSTTSAPPLAGLRSVVKPPASRPSVFYRGYDVLDEDNVGFVSDDRAAAMGFRYDTSQPGNGNGASAYAKASGMSGRRGRAKASENGEAKGTSGRRGRKTETASKSSTAAKSKTRGRRGTRAAANPK